MTPNSFLKDEATQACCTLVEAIKETIEASIIGHTKWVINLEEPKESASLDTSMFGSVSIIPKCNRPRKFVYYGSGSSTKS